MIQITDIILISLFIEAIVNALKPLWTAGEKKMTVSELVSKFVNDLFKRLNLISCFYIVVYKSCIRKSENIRNCSADCIKLLLCA